MNSITRKIYVTRQTLPNPIEYIQGTNALPIIFTFVDYTIPEETAAKVYVEKPSRHCEYNLATIADNTVTVDVKDTMFDEVGTSNLQIKLTKDDKTLITFDYPVRVSKNRVAGNVPQSGDNSDLIDDLLAKGGPAVEAAEAATDRANAAADRLEGTDVGTLANELDAHTGSQVNTSNGVHGMRINDGQLYIGSLGRWDKAIDRTYANPRILPDSSDLSRVSEPGVYAGKNPAGALSDNTQYILVVAKAGDGLISRSVTFPFEDAIYLYSASKSSWLPVNAVKNDTYVENGITVNITKVNKTCQIFINTDQSKIPSCSAWNEVTILTLPQEYRPEIDAMYGMIGESGEQYADLANHQYWIVMYPDGRINLACRDKGFNTAPSNYGWRFSATYITAE